MKYVPALDGLRAIAIALVVAFHARAPFTPGGYVGVDVFFVLSGYLITKSWGNRPISAVGGFYVRRLHRLLPALLVLVLAYLAAAPLLWPGWDHATSALLALTYLSSFTVPALYEPDLLLHTWSLSVEMVFYLAWPFALTAARDPSRRLTLLTILFLIATAWRMLAVDYFPGRALYYRADFRASGLILGSIVAMLPAMSPHRLLAPCGFAILGLVAFTMKLRDPAFPAAAQTLVEVASAMALLGAPAYARTLGAPPVAYLGRISYGVYLWHYPVVRWCRDQDMSWAMQLLVSGALGIALGALSYHFVESRYFQHPVRRQVASGSPSS